MWLKWDVYISSVVSGRVGKTTYCDGKPKFKATWQLCDDKYRVGRVWCLWLIPLSDDCLFIKGKTLSTLNDFKSSVYYISDNKGFQNMV